MLDTSKVPALCSCLKLHGRVFQEDLQLARRLIGGDPHTFRLFVDGYAQRLAAFVMRHTGADHASAEDIVQDTLIRAIRALPQYRGEASLYTWLCQICRSEMVDQHRKAVRRPQTVSLDAHPRIAALVDARAAPEELPFDLSGAGSGSKAAILRSLALIPGRYAQALEWKYGDDASVDEIGRMLGISSVAAQSLLAGAREALRDVWRTQSGESPIEGGAAAPGQDRG